jgi:hypothetical protein
MKTLLCHDADTAYGDDPSQPTEDIRHYRLLAHNMLITLK